MIWYKHVLEELDNNFSLEKDWLKHTPDSFSNTLPIRLGSSYNQTKNEIPLIYRAI